MSFIDFYMWLSGWVEFLFPAILMLVAGALHLLHSGIANPR